MKLSGLQRFILKNCYGSRSKVLRVRFGKFYNGKKRPNKLERIKIISKSIDRLINKGLLIGSGEKTQHKWFIKEVQLTRLGRRVAKKLMGEQTVLPLKKKRLIKGSNNK